MAEELKIQVSLEGADKVAAGLNNVGDALNETATDAKKAGDALKNQLKTGAAQAGTAITNLNRVVNDSPYGFIGIANNIDPLFESFRRLKTETGSTGGAFKALISSLSGPAGIGLAITAVTTAITFAQIGFRAWGGATKEAKEANDDFQKTLAEAGKSAISTGERLQAFVNVAKNGQLPLEQRNEALREANKIMGEHGQKLTLVNVGTEAVTRQVQLYTQATIAQAVSQKYADKIADLIIKKNEILLQQSEQQNKVYANSAAVRVQSSKLLVKSLGNDEVQAYKALTANDDLVKSQEDLVDIGKDLASVTNEIAKLQGLLAKSTQDATLAFGELGYKAKETKKKIKQEFDGLAKLPSIEISIQRNTFSNAVNKLINQGIEVPITPVLPEIKDFAYKWTENFADAVNKFMENAAANIGTNFAETLGNVISGQAKLGDLFSGLFATLGEAVAQLGKELIQIGTLAVVAQSALSQLLANPFAAIAVGIALTALGTALKNIMSKDRFAVGTRFAPGGMALVGERGPEMVSLPRGSQVIPAAQTAAMMGGRQQVEVVGVLRGQDIYFSNKKYGQTYARQS